MAARPLIYVRRITNLSDARYCAGMGVDFLGFAIDPSDPDFVNAETFQQLIGWVSGPARVVECGSVAFDEKIRASYAPDYLHITLDRLEKQGTYPVPLIVEISFSKLSALSGEYRNRKDIAYWLVIDQPDDASTPFQSASPVLIGKEKFPEGVTSLLDRTGAAGVALRGSVETSPGLKDYDHLSHVLEELNG